MKKTLCVLLLLLLMEGGLKLVGSEPVKENFDLGSFLPKDVQGWRAEGKDEFYNPETIFDYIDGTGEVYRSYNFRRLLARRFKKEGKPDIIVDFFDMGSSHDAFGVFTHDLEGEDWGIGQGSTYKGGLLSFWRDRYFVSLTAEEETSEAEQALMALGKHIAAAIGKEGPKPSLLNLLPAEIVARKNIHYFHNHLILNYHFFVSDENILKLDQRTEAVLARMGEKGQRSYLLLVVYSDAKKASQAYTSFTKIYMPDAAEPGLVQTEDKTWTAVRTQGQFLAVVFDAPTAASAKDWLTNVEEKIKG